MLRIVVGIMAAALVAGCAAGDPAPRRSTPSAAPASASTRPSVGVASPASPTAVPGEAPLLPPAATLRGLPGEGTALEGALGSFTWGDVGSDAPWVVPSPAGLAPSGRPLSVSFEPPLVPRSWVARWARVRGTTAGDLSETAEGAGPIEVAAPTGGTWSLQVEARFAPGRQGTWYWRLEVGP